MGYNYQQGVYEVKNKHKYLGKKNPRFLSSYEFRVFRHFDHHKDITRWGAEIVVVRYYNPVKQRKARYIVDVYVEYVDRDGNPHKELIEIKPEVQTKKPVKRGRKRKDVYDYELLTYATNRAKWEAAEKYARERGWTFKVLTERGIFKHV